MIAIRVRVQTHDAEVEYIAHAVNRSRHALTGATRNAWRKYPQARSVIAEYTTHDCSTCARSHNLPPVRKVYRQKRKTA